MKLKLIAAALGLIASAASQATIIPTTTVGGSSLMLTVWEQKAPGGQPDQSFTLTLPETFTQFVNNSGTSATLATLLSTDTTWSGFLASSDTTDVGALQWSVIASGNKAQNNRPAIFGTVTAGTDPTTLGLTNNNVVASNSQVQTTVGNMNANTTANEQINAVGTGRYYQDFQLANFNGQGFSNGNNIGGTANVETAAYVLGSAATDFTTLTQLAGTMNFSQVGSNYVLSYSVSAVPEAPGSALMLAGIGALGLLALRRNKA